MMMVVIVIYEKVLFLVQTVIPIPHVGKQDILIFLVVQYVNSVCRTGVGDVCFFLTMRCFNDAMFSNS